MLLLLTYAQALFGIIPLRQAIRWRGLWGGISPVARPPARGERRICHAILTTDYETTAWLRFTSPA